MKLMAIVVALNWNDFHCFTTYRATHSQKCTQKKTGSSTTLICSYVLIRVVTLGGYLGGFYSLFTTCQLLLGFVPAERFPATSHARRFPTISWALSTPATAPRRAVPDGKESQAAETDWSQRRHAVCNGLKE